MGWPVSNTHCVVLPIDTLLGPAAAASTRSSLPEIKSSRLGPAASLSESDCLLLGGGGAAADAAAVARVRLNACVHTSIGVSCKSFRQGMHIFNSEPHLARAGYD